MGFNLVTYTPHSDRENTVTRRIINVPSWTLPRSWKYNTVRTQCTQVLTLTKLTSTLSCRASISVALYILSSQLARLCSLPVQLTLYLSASSVVAIKLLKNTALSPVNGHYLSLKTTCLIVIEPSVMRPHQHVAVTWSTIKPSTPPCFGKAATVTAKFPMTTCMHAPYNCVHKLRRPLGTNLDFACLDLTP